MGMLNQPEKYDGKVRKNYQESLEVVARKGKGTRTKQSFKDECDVNNIVKKYTQTGVLTHIRQAEPRYGDFTQITSYQDAVHAVMAAEESFMQLNPKLRAKFNNDPGQLLAFLDDPKNDAESRRLGLRPSLTPQGGTTTRKASLDAQASTKQQTPAKTSPNDDKGNA